MNVLRDLLRIKDFRESQAELQVHRQHDAVRQAQEKHEAEQGRLAQMLREGMETEQHLYRQLCERVVRLHDIEDVQLTVADLRQREARQQDTVNAARETENKANLALTDARAAHQEAHRQKTKFVDLSHDFDTASAREAERREEMEMEEVAGVKRNHEGWTEHDQDKEPQ